MYKFKVYVLSWYIYILNRIATISIFITAQLYNIVYVYYTVCYITTAYLLLIVSFILKHHQLYPPIPSFPGNHHKCYIILYKFDFVLLYM